MSSCHSTQEGIKLIPHKTPSKEIWLNAIMTRQSNQIETIHEPVDRDFLPTAADTGCHKSKSDRMTDGLAERAVIEQILLLLSAQTEETECSYIRNEICHICGPGSQSDKITVVNCCARLVISHSFCQRHFDYVSTTLYTEAINTRKLKCPVCCLKCLCDKCAVERKSLFQRYREWNHLSNNSTQANSVTKSCEILSDHQDATTKSVDATDIGQTQINNTHTDENQERHGLISPKPVSGFSHTSTLNSKLTINALCSPTLISSESITDGSVKAEKRKSLGHSVVYMLNSCKPEQRDDEIHGEATSPPADIKSFEQSKNLVRSSSRLAFASNKKKVEEKQTDQSSADTKIEVPISRCKLRRKTSEPVRSNPTYDMRHKASRIKRNSVPSRDTDKREKSITSFKRSRSANDTPGMIDIFKPKDVIEAKDSVDEQDESSDEHDTNLDYCSICLKDGDLVCCDVCPRSFHLDCLQLRQEDLPKGDWQCERCKQRQSKRTRFMAEISAKNSLANKCKHLISCLSNSSLSKHFQHPVDDVPNYKKIIAFPMDFSTIQRKIRRRMYEMQDGEFDLVMFASDVRLIWSNCRNFNDDDSGIVRAAELLESDFEHLYASVVQFHSQNKKQLCDVSH